MQEVLPGEVISDEIPSVPQAEIAVSTIAHFHASAINFSIGETNQNLTFHHLNEKHAEIEAVITEARGGVRKSAQRLLEVYEQFAANPPAKLPSIVVHGDLNKKNFLFAGKEAHLIDFDYFYVENRMSDLAQFCSSEWTMQNGQMIDFDLVEHFVKEYHHQNPISLEEAQHIDVYMMVDLLRIWMWRVLWQMEEKEKRIHSKTRIEQERMEHFLKYRSTVHKIADTL